MIWRFLIIFCIGIYLGKYIPIENTRTPLLELPILILWGIFLIILILGKKLDLELLGGSWKKMYFLGWKGLSLLKFALSGILLTLIQDPRTHPSYFGREENMNLLVSIDENPFISGSLYHFRARVLGSFNSTHTLIKETGFLDINMPVPKEKITYGQSLYISGKVKRIIGNPHPAFFNYAAFKEYHHVFFQIFLSPGKYQKGNFLLGNPFLIKIFQAQNWANKKLDREIKDTLSLGFIKTLLMGFRNGLNSDFIQSFINTGTVHILSISGMHMALLFDLLSRILYPLRRISMKGKTLSRCIQIGFLWFYAFLSGGSTPVLRSAWMMSLTNIRDMFRRRTSTLQILGGSAFIQLFQDTSNLFDLSFQLSYGAIISIILFQKPIQGLFGFENPILKYLSSMITGSLAAQIGTLPLILKYFHQFPVYFILANLLIIPLSSLILYIGILYLTFIFLGLPLSFLGLLLKSFTQVLYKSAFFISKLHFSTLNGLYPDWVEFLILYSIITSLFFFLNTRMRKFGRYILYLFAILWIWHLGKDRISQKQNTLYFLNKKNYGFVLICQGQKGYLYSFSKEREIKHLIQEEFRDLPLLIRFHNLKSIQYPRILTETHSSLRRIGKRNYPLPSSPFCNTQSRLQLNFSLIHGDSLRFDIPKRFPLNELCFTFWNEGSRTRTQGKFKTDSYFYTNFN